MKTLPHFAAAALCIGIFSATVTVLEAKPAPKPPPPARPVVKREVFGKTKDGETVEIFTLTGARGVRARVMTWGATLVSMETPDRNGRTADVTLGFDTLEGYLGNHPYIGVTAGRYANRIAKGKFTLDGVEYALATNNGANHLHGGNKGFDKKNWAAAILKDAHGVRFSLTSADGDEGYPGKLRAGVTYSITEDNELRIDYDASTDKPTIINLTNHAYWNLSGGTADDVLGHELRLNAKSFTPVDEGSIPTGKIEPVAGGPMDFTKTKTVGKDFAKMTGTPGGYDHNFVINHPAKTKTAVISLAAELGEPRSGRVMKVFTTEPGLQFYTGNHLDGSIAGKGGKVYGKNAGLCLETQHYPDSPNQPDFPSTVLRPGKPYRSTTIHSFSVR